MYIDNSLNGYLIKKTVLCIFYFTLFCLHLIHLFTRQKMVIIIITMDVLTICWQQGSLSLPCCCQCWCQKVTGGSEDSISVGAHWHLQVWRQTPRWSIHHLLEGGRVLVWDATCPDTMAQSNRPLAMREVEAVVTEMEQRKRLNMPILTPAISSFHWQWGYW